MKEQLPTIQTPNPKIDEYVERIKGGADKESVLQGLPPSWIAAVEGKLGSKIEVTEQVVDSEIVTQQQEEKNKKVQKEQEEINRLREQLGVIPKTATFEGLENNQPESPAVTEQVEQESDMQENIKKIMGEHASLVTEMDTFLHGMQIRFRESEDATFAPRYQNALAEDFEKLKKVTTIEGVSKGYEDIAKTIGEMEYAMEYGAMYTNNQEGEIKDLEIMEDALKDFMEEIKKVTVGLSVQFEKTKIKEIQFLNYAENVLKDKIQRLINTLDDKRSRLVR